MNLKLPHTATDCDERCRCCSECYQRTGDSVCELTCEHARQNAVDSGEACEFCGEPCWEDVPCHRARLSELGVVRP